MRETCVVRFILVVSILALVGCKPAVRVPSPEYQNAIAAFERVAQETHDYDYVDPRFDDVIAQLRAVPEADQSSAMALVRDIEKKRAEATASRRKAGASVVAREHAAEAADESFTESEVKAWHAKLEALIKTRQVEALMQQFDPACSITITTNGDTQTMDVKEYGGHLTEAFEISSAYEYASTVRSISIDGTRATIKTTVQETLTLPGMPAMSTVTDEIMTVEKRDGRILIVKTVGVAQSAGK